MLGFQVLERLAWGLSKTFFVCARKGRIILKTACIADLGDRCPFRNQILCEKQSFGREIIADRVAGLLFECVNHIRAA